MHPGRVVFLLVAALMLAGCTGAPTDDDAGSQGGSDDQGGAIDAPEWNVGDYWTYDSPNGTFSLVVSGEEGSDWVMETTGSDLALFHARDEVSYLGKIGKSGLTGSQGGDRVKFFDFPLEDGKQWSTTWDGLSLSITASLEADGKYLLEGLDGERLHVDYVYDAQTGFFEEATWYDANGQEQWGLSLTDSGGDFTGTLHRYEFGKTHQFVETIDGTGYNELEIAGEWNELEFVTVLLCNDDPAGQILIGVNSPAAEENPLPMLPGANEPEDGDSLDCMGDSFSHRVWEMENSGGLWEIGIAVGTANGIAVLIITERAHNEISFPG